jgi:hypothetical protein
VADRGARAVAYRVTLRLVTGKTASNFSTRVNKPENDDPSIVKAIKVAADVA